MEDDTPSFGRTRYDRMDFSGDSYLLRPDKLLRAFQTANQVEAANYLMLAARRNFAAYQVTGDFSLPLKHIAIPKSRLEKNSLLDIQGNNIHFTLEN